MVNVWFDGWEPILRVLVVGTLGYVTLVLLLRSSGKRTLAQMNSFDFVVIVAIGAAFGGVLTARSVPLAEAVTAFGVLIGLQYLVSALETRLPFISTVLAAAPRMLAYDGVAIPGALRKERLTENQLQAAVRRQGYGDLGETVAVVLEPDGTVTVLGQGELGEGSAMQPVQGA